MRYSRLLVLKIKMLRHIKKKGVISVGLRSLHYVVPDFNKIMEQEKAIGVYTSEEY